MPKTPRDAQGKPRLALGQRGSCVASGLWWEKTWEPESDSWSSHFCHKIGQGLNPNSRSMAKGRRPKKLGEEKAWWLLECSGAPQGVPKRGACPELALGFGKQLFVPVRGVSEVENKIKYTLVVCGKFLSSKF